MSLRTLAFVVCAALVGPAGSVHAVCTAAQIVNNEAACGVPACFISKQYTVEDGCTLDFGGREVTLQRNGSLSVGSGVATLRAGTLIVHGRIAGVGDQTGARGGMVIIETTGDFTVGQFGDIDVRGDRSGGDIIARIGGSALIVGKMRASFLTGAAAGGLISLTAAGNINTTATAMLIAEGGIDSEGGGEIDLIAGNAITLLADLRVFGFDGGFAVLEAGGKITMQGIDASGRGDAGSGGCVDLVAGAGAEIKGKINATGAGGLFMTGGCGGLVCLDGGLGELRIANGAEVDASGASPDGGGGQIALLTRGNAFIAGGITSRGPAGETCGGDLCVDAGFDAQLSGTGLIDVSGGDAGGDLEIAAGRDIRIDSLIDASGRQSGSLGGDITLRAGIKGSGSLSIASTVDVSSDAACSDANGCGQGGLTDLSGCDVTFTGAVLASGPEGGHNVITARELLSSFGQLDAIRTVSIGHFGTNQIMHRAGRMPIVQTSNIHPGPTILALTTCPLNGPTEPPCLTPCPVCGDGAVDFPETCDQAMIPPASCSGCSAFCQLEDCNDGLSCTADSCNPSFGCVNRPTPLCVEPTATVTNTPPTPTFTPTPSPTPSRSITRTVTSTPAASDTPTATAVATASATVTITATPSLSATVTITAPATPTHTLSPTHTIAATPSSTATETPSPELTVTAPPSCPGDCDGVNGVAINELILGVNIALGHTLTSACPAFDADDSGTVLINELISAVNAALNGC